MLYALLSGAAASLLLTVLLQLFHYRFRAASAAKWIFRHPGLLLSGMLPVFALFILALGAAGRTLPALSLTVAVAALFGYTDYLMLGYRDTPFVPRDLSMALNLGQLLTMISPANVTALCVGLAAAGVPDALISRHLPPLEIGPNSRIILAAAGIGCLLLFASAGRDQNPARRLFLLLGADFDAYLKDGNTYALYDRNGFLVSFFSLCMRPIMERPADYGKEKIERLASMRSNAGIAKPAPFKRPHILFIMSEAFTDPTRLPELRFSEDPIPLVRSLMSRYPSGQVLSPGYGGGTAHCEFEALTGFSTALTGGISPFENNINKQHDFPAFPRQLRELGYRTTALHPYKRGMYARTRAYPAIGLERFIDITGMRHTGTPDNSPYVSDEEAYAELLELLEESSSPQFVHLVTMQNHGDYSRRGRFQNTIRIRGALRPKNIAGLETYAQGLRYTDIATAGLLDKLSGWKEDVLVLFWGDHLPGVYPTGFLDGFTRQKFETPFFIWANFPLPNQSCGTVSPMFLSTLASGLAGLPAAPYNVLLRQLHTQLHGIHSRFLIDAGDHVIHPEDMQPQARSLLSQLRLLQYDAMLGRQYAKGVGFFEK